MNILKIIKLNVISYVNIKLFVKIVLGFLLLFFCILAGYGAVLYGDWIDNKIIKITILPLIYIFIVIFLYDKKILFLLFIAIRVPIDPLIEASRQVSSFSPGALMNAFLLLIAILLFFENPRPMWHVVIPLWIPLIIIIIFELLRAPDRVNSIRTALSYSTNIAVFAIPFYVRQCQDNMKFSCHLVLISSLIPVFYGFIDLAQGGHLSGRVSSTFPHPNIFAFYLVVVIALLLYKIKDPFMSKSAIEKWICISYMFVVITMLLLTKTRSAWAATLGIFLLYAMLFEKKYFFYIGIAGILILLIPSVRDRIGEINTAPVYWGHGQDSYEWRKELWDTSWSWTKPSALPFGHGLDAFMYYSQEFFPLAYGRDVGAHSVYRQWLFEAGILGVLCAGWLYFWIAKMSWQLHKITKLGTTIIFMILIEYLVVSYSDNMLSYLLFNWIYWFLLGTACSIAYTKYGSPFFKTFNKSSGTLNVLVLKI